MKSTFNFRFTNGLKDGLPIALGYLSVSFAYGILAVNYGLPVWTPIITSLSNFTGTGQFVGTQMISMGNAIAEIALTLFIINARYILMSISLSQRLTPDFKIWQRMVIAFGNTDEIFAVAMGKNSPLNFRYLLGLCLSSFTGWVGGTILGAFCGSLIPESVTTVLSIALPAMYIAIIIPNARYSKAITIIILIAAAISCLFTYTPYLNKLENYWVIIIAGVTAALIGALLFPIKIKEEYLSPPEYEDKEDTQ